MSSKVWNKINATDYARLSINPLRVFRYDKVTEPNAKKKVIMLQLGDPTLFGNLPPSKQCLEALKKSLETDTLLYNTQQGRLEAREAVAQYSRHRGVVDADDVMLTCGCGHAVEMCIMSLVEPGENLLIPRPCYNYRTFTDGLHIETRFYNLDPSNDWNADLKHMESLIDEKTRAILVNNPGNPCGNVFRKEHILEILDIAERHKVPIISDEIYEFLTFPGVEFHSVASLSKNVPVLTTSSLSKRFLMPGVRMGWIIISDRHEALKDVKKGLHNVTGRILGPNSTVQQALPEILRNTPQKFFDSTMQTLSLHAKLACDILQQAPGLKPIMPKGSMYMMIEIQLPNFPEFPSCVEFTEGLIREQSVLLLPSGPCFYSPGFLRMVLLVPEDMIIEGCERMREFCDTHFVQL